MSDSILEKLTPVFRGTFADATLVPTREMSAKDVARWNSLTHVELIAAVEQAFGVKFQLKDLMKMKNVGDLVDTLQRLQDAKK